MWIHIWGMKKEPQVLFWRYCCIILATLSYNFSQNTYPLKAKASCQIYISRENFYIITHLTSNKLKLPYWNAVPALNIAHLEPRQEFLHVICTFEWMPWISLSNLWEMSNQQLILFFPHLVSHIWSKNHSSHDNTFWYQFWSHFTGIFLTALKDLWKSIAGLNLSTQAFLWDISVFSLYFVCQDCQRINVTENY